MNTTTTAPAAVAFDAAELKAALARLKPLISGTKYGSPVLRCVRVDHDGERATLTATDLANWLQIRLTAPSLDTGSFLVPFDRLAKVASVHTKGTIALAGTDTEATIRFERSTVTVETQAVKEFPAAPVPAGTEIPLNLDLLADILPAVSRDDSRPILCSVRIEDGRYVATDSYRLYVYEHAQSTRSREPFLVPRSTVVLATKAHKGTVWGNVDERHVQITLDENTTLTGRLVEGAFPPYRSLVPVTDNVIVDLPDTFPADVKRLVKLGSGDASDPIKIMPRDGGGLLLTRGSMHDAKVTTECEGSTQLEIVGWHPQYLLDLIAGMGNLHLRGIDHLKPSFLRDEAPQLGEGVVRTRLLMPVRVS